MKTDRDKSKDELTSELKETRHLPKDTEASVTGLKLAKAAAQGRRTIFEHYLSDTNRGEVDVDKIVSMISLFTPADIEYLFQKVRQVTFESEYEKEGNSLVTTATFLEMIPEISPASPRKSSMNSNRTSKNILSIDSLLNHELKKGGIAFLFGM